MTVLRNVLRNVLSNPLADPLDRFGGFLPSQLTGLKAWFRFNSGITVTGAGVSQWDDASGEGNHLLQATDTNRPSKEADGSILFDGVDNFLKCSAFTWNQPETIYILGKQISWAANKRIIDGNTNNSGIIYQLGSSPTVQLFAGLAVASNSDWTLNAYATVVATFNGASSLLQINNNTASTGDAGSNNLAGLTLGASGGTTNFSNIQIKEVIGYDTAHDAATREQVINYLNSL